MSEGQGRETTYDVRIWKTEKYKGSRVTTYKVRWVVAGRPWKEPFRTTALAESFRSQLVTAARKGEAFDVSTGRPVSFGRGQIDGITWYEFACQYVDMKWPAAAGKYRKSIAEALTSVTVALLPQKTGPEPARLRSALANWAFNTRQRSGSLPDEITTALDWAAAHSPRLVTLSDHAVLRSVLDAMATRLDGGRSAGTVVNRKRAVLSNALSYAVERQLIPSNPIGSIRWKAPKSSVEVDRRCVPNPDQARALLSAGRVTKRSGRRLYAFFACLYYSGLRPEEAVNLREHWLELPESGWGWITLETAAPDVGKAWSEAGTQREERQLKHRAVGETRRVPCPPELVIILRDHLAEFPPGPDGRVFRGERGGELATITYVRMWDRARVAVLGEEEAERSPLARRPYDLRHAAVSTWLASSSDPAQVAEWAGHSVDVLLKVYVKVLDGRQEETLRRIQDTLSPAKTDHEPSDRRDRRRVPSRPVRRPHPRR